MMRADLADLAQAIQQYRSGTASLDELKARVLATAERVTEYDRRALRTFLLDAEGRLDMIQFTTDSNRVYTKTLPVVDELAKAIRQDEDSR
jgi:hypothetical protein